VTRYIGGKEGTRLRREVKKLTVTSHQLCRNLNIYRGNLGWILCRFGVDLEWIWGRFGVDWSGFGVDLEWIWSGFGVDFCGSGAGAEWIWGRFLWIRGRCGVDLGSISVDPGPVRSGFAVDGSSDDFGRNLDVYFMAPMEPLVMPSKPG
jgi:hypothetical protein